VAEPHDQPVVSAAWVDGIEATQLSVFDRGLHYGDGLFETIACPRGSPRLLERHLARLRRGCERLALDPPSPEVLAREIRALAAGGGRCIVKLLLTRGASRVRGYRPTQREPSTRVLLRYSWPVYDPSLALSGVRVRTAGVRLGENPALAGIKHLNRLEQVLAAAEPQDADVSEALMLSSSGAVISGIMSNVFMVDDSQLVTPDVERCGVAGIMRELVLEAASSSGIPVQVRRLGPEELTGAAELFLTSALIGVRPVRELDGRLYTIGAVTRRVQGLMATQLAEGAGSGHA
jgi:4-amino-4-deoxychorismate lyase